MTGQRSISEEYLHKIANFLEISSETLKFGDDCQKNAKKEEFCLEEWKMRAPVAEAKLEHLRRAVQALGQHVSALGLTVDDFSRIISE